MSSLNETPQNPLEESSSSKRLQILEVARHRFMHYGVSKTSMRDIAGDLGIAVSNLYLYFENKNQLVLAIANECHAEQDRRLQSILTESTLQAPEKLKQFLLQKFRTIQEFGQDSPHGKELLAYLLQQFPERIQEWEKSFEAAISAILEHGKVQGDFHFQKVGETARMIRLSTAIFFLPPFVSLPKPKCEADLTQLIDWLTQSLLTSTNPDHKENSK